MRVERFAEAGHIRVTVRGDIDLTTVGELSRQLSAAARDEERDVVVDLRDVTFLDSTGVRALVDAYKEAERKGHEMSVSGARSWVAKMLELTGVAGLLSRRNRPV